jgi:hypothetical protein
MFFKEANRVPNAAWRETVFTNNNLRTQLCESSASESQYRRWEEIPDLGPAPASLRGKWHDKSNTFRSRPLGNSYAECKGVAGLAFRDSSTWAAYFIWSGPLVLCLHETPVSADVQVGEKLQPAHRPFWHRGCCISLAEASVPRKRIPRGTCFPLGVLARGGVGQISRSPPSQT